MFNTPKWEERRKMRNLSRKMSCTETEKQQQKETLKNFGVKAF